MAGSMAIPCDTWTRETARSKAPYEAERGHGRGKEHSPVEGASIPITETVASIVHEMRSHVGAIRNMTGLLLRGLKAEGDSRELAQLILDETGTLQKFIRELLRASQPFEAELQACAVEDVLEQAQRLSQPRAEAEQVEVEWECEGDLPLLSADTRLLGEALANVVVNAIEAAGWGGRVHVRAGKAGGHVVFEVLDNGPGFDLEPGEDPFRPFFTKKEGGTGLGLAIVRRILAAHRGKVACSNRPEGGAQVELGLPGGELAFGAEAIACRGERT